MTPIEGDARAQRVNVSPDGMQDAWLSGKFRISVIVDWSDVSIIAWRNYPVSAHAVPSMVNESATGVVRGIDTK